MKIFKNTKILFTMLAIFISFQSLGSKTVVVSFGASLQPWVNVKTNDGFIVELIQTALSFSGYTVKAVYHPYLRRASEYANGNVDVVSDMNTKTIKKEGLNGFFVPDVYAYQNYAFSLASKNYKIDKISDLKKYSLLSWQGARTHLGGEYKEMANNHKKYKEVHDQKAQVKLLYLNRYDVVQMDLEIFKYYDQILKKEGSTGASQKVDKFPLFGASPNGYLFKDKKVRDDFVKGLKRIQANPEKYSRLNSIIYKK